MKLITTLAFAVTFSVFAIAQKTNVGRKTLAETLPSYAFFDGNTLKESLLTDPHLAETARKLDKSLDNLAIKVRAEINSISPDGILVSAEFWRRSGRSKQPDPDSRIAAFIHGRFPTQVDGDIWIGTVYPVGRYQYNAVDGSLRTVSAFVQTKEAALSADRERSDRFRRGILPDAADVRKGLALSLLAITAIETPDPIASKKFFLHLPVEVNFGSETLARDVHIQAYFFDVVDASRVERTAGKVIARWKDGLPDGKLRGTEIAEVTYELLAEPTSRKYYGYLIRVYFKGELQASIGTPGTLFRRYPAPLKMPYEDQAVANGSFDAK